MSQAEKAIFSVTNLTDTNKHLTERERKARKSVKLNPVSLKQVIDYINLQDVDPELKDVLRKKASRYPHQALQKFVDNFSKILATEHRKLGKGYVIPSPQQQAAVTEPTRKPSRQYHAPEPKPIIKAKKIVIEEIPVEPPELPVELQVEELGMKPADDPFDVDVPAVVATPPAIQFTPIPPPTPAKQPPVPPPQKKKFVPFSATLSPEDFE